MSLEAENSLEPEKGKGQPIYYGALELILLSCSQRKGGFVSETFKSKIICYSRSKKLDFKTQDSE